MMKKIIYLSLIALLLIPATTSLQADASLVSNRAYRAEQKQEYKQNLKQIKELFKVHNEYANAHDIKKLKPLYADSYINSDGFNKEIYFKSIEETWKSCEDLTYTTDILNVDINGNYANIQVEETATGTVVDSLDMIHVTGEIHSKSKGIYHLVKINEKWYISGETAISDESSLLYGDARFMNIEIQAPSQVYAGETYTASVKIDAEPTTLVLGSVDHDILTYPSSTPKNDLRPVPQPEGLERLIKANTQNINEYAVSSLIIYKAALVNNESIKQYLAGLACVMRRVNVVPKNNYIDYSEEKNESSNK